MQPRKVPHAWSVGQRFRYIPALDGLRGVAVLLVVVFHGGPAYAPGGFIGVDVFFVLSGFLITALLIDEWAVHQTINFKHFYVRRVLRLLPAFVGLLITFLIVSYVCSTRERFATDLNEALISFFYLSNWTRALGYGKPDFLGHTWSLAIEEQFYLLWPIVLATIIRFAPSPRWILGAAIGCGMCSWLASVLLAHLGATPERLYNGFDTRAYTLLVGCAVAISLAFEMAGRKLLALLKLAGALSALTLVMFAVNADWRSPYMYVLGFPCVAICTSVTIAALTHQGSVPSMLHRVLEARPLVYLGKISYGVYLWHYLVFRALPATSLSGMPLIKLGVGMLLSLVLATLSFFLLERPFLRFRPSFSGSREHYSSGGDDPIRPITPILARQDGK